MTLNMCLATRHFVSDRDMLRLFRHLFDRISRSTSTSADFLLHSDHKSSFHKLLMSYAVSALKRLKEV